jgi:hypothetical protein
MPNIKFNYLYRDSANYKKIGYVIFANPNKIELAELEKLIKSKLINELWFYADEWKLPVLFTECLDFRINPTWHEFEGLEYTDEPENAPFDLNELSLFKNSLK